MCMQFYLYKLRNYITKCLVVSNFIKLISGAAPSPTWRPHGHPRCKWLGPVLRETRPSRYTPGGVTHSTVGIA